MKRPLSAFYYIKENRSRGAVLVVLLFLTTLFYLAGNYIDSVGYYWEKAVDYDDRICLVGALSADEDQRDYKEFIKLLEEDDSLIVMPRSGRGFSGLEWKCTMGFEMGSYSFAFNSPEDMKTAFDRLGIEADLSDTGDRCVVMSSALARQYGLEAGSVLDSSVNGSIPGSYRVSALTEDDSYVLFYVHEDTNLTRANIMSDTLSGDELRRYLEEKRGDLRVFIPECLRDTIAAQLDPFFRIFIFTMFVLSVIHATTINAVLAGHFIKRRYEFGIYRAMGMPRKDVFKKVASEICLADLIAVLCGAVFNLLLTFMLNELVYIPAGEYLPYFSTAGLSGFILSNLTVVIPVILIRSSSMCRADVTDF